MSFPLINPILQFFDNSGNVLSGGKLFVYEPGTTTKKTTYSDENLSVANANPIILDSAGRCTIFLTDGAEYKFVLSASTDTDPPAAPIRSVDEVKSPSALTGAAIGAGLWPRTSAEITAGVTPTNYAYEPGDIRRFGPALDGTTDDTTAVTNWAAVAGHHTFPVAQTAKITAAIALVSNSTYEFVAGARIETATQNISLFSASSKTNIKIHGGHFKQTSAGNDAYTGGVTLTSCTYCEVTGCEFEGMQWAGVYLDSSSQCIVENNYFHDFLSSSAGDKTDICVYRNSSFNTIKGNRCFAGLEADHGILVQDPGGIGTYLPRYNKVLNNFVGDHKSYGIAVYIGGSQEGNNQVLGNTIQGVTGTGVAGASGTGIYCVGHGLGSMQVHDNIIRDCCSATTSAANAPAGITVTDTVAGSMRVSIKGNTVEFMTQAHGILVSGVLGGAVVSGNTVRMPVDNDGTGAGGATLAGNCIKCFNSDNVTISSNEVLHNGPQDGIFVHATDTDHKNIKVIGNGCVTAAGNPIRFDRSSTFVHTNVTISANTCETASNTPNALALAGLDRASVTGNTGGCGSQAAIAVTACTLTRFSNNIMNCTGSNAVTTSGTCTSSFYDRSNSIPGAFSNSGTGFTFEKLLTGSATFNPTNLADGAGETTTVPVTGAAPGERAFATFSNDLSGITLSAWVSSGDTVSVRFQNESGGTIDLASGTLRAYVIKN